jgi:hypothetical protein
MKQIILGDTHGRDVWKTILAAEGDTVDRVVFIGDYVDTHENTTPIEQVENLREIIAFKQNNKEKVVLLVGNHDFHYWPGIDEHYSGYQPMMRMSFEYEYRKYSHLFQIAFSDERGYLYTHAGVTQTFLKNLGITDVSVNEIVKKLNSKFKHQPYKFGYFDGDFSGYGEDIRQTCIWVRPQSLYKDQFDLLQIVGHTTISKINHPHKSDRRGFYLIDALGTSREYLVIVDGEITIKQLPK